MTTPRIGILGTGAIGGFYGLMLAKAGQDVHFLLRSDYHSVSEHGLRIHSGPLGELQLKPVQAYQRAEDMPRCDWIFIATKTTGTRELLPALLKVAAPNAKVVLMQNGLGVEDELRPQLPDDLHLLGGLCFICAHRTPEGVIEHQAMGGINLAYHSGPATTPEARLNLAQEATDWFKAAGLEANAMAELGQARWQKLVWNAPYNGLSVLLNTGTEALMGHPDTLALIEAIMEEVVMAAAADGYPLPPELPSKMLKNTLRMPNYLPSMYHDFQLKRPMELEAIYVRALEKATAAGVEMPRTRMLLQNLRFLEDRALGR